MARTRIALLLLWLLMAGVGGCYRFLPPDGGGQTEFSPPRKVRASDVAVPPGYHVEVVASGLTFPTGVAFDDSGDVYVVESGYAYGEVWTPPRLLRINSDGSTTEIARGGDNGPWNGVTYVGNHFYVAEGGELEGGRILRISESGDVSYIIEDLPSMGDHHTNGPVIGPDGKVYFGQGTATNSGVVGEDNFKYGWLERFPNFHDTPCKDTVLTGRNFTTPNVLDGGQTEVTTGAYSPFGTPTEAGEIIEGELPCNGAVMRLDTDGTGLEVVAWGFRNPYGLAFAPDGQLYVTANAYDVRGSRPVWGAGDHLWRVEEGAWYGWPDYSGGMPLNSEHFAPPGGPQPSLLIQDHPGKPPQPVATFGVHASANGIDFSRSPDFGYRGQAFVAEFGDLSPSTGKSLHPVGFQVVRVDVKTGHVVDFAINKSSKGPASKNGGGGLERPIAVRFNRSGNALYVVDFGVMLAGDTGPVPQPQTGVLWKITAGGAPP